MNKYKICVYAIAKNEEQFVDRWYESVKDADKIYVLDTGSTDNTAQKLKSHGVIVKTLEIKPWRFDTARNKALEMVDEDTDICISIDIDEVLLPGWRQELENNWEKNTTRIYYNYNWRLDENNKPIVNFYIEKIHARHGYIWTHPVHEILTYLNGQENKKTVPSITVNHYPDNTKSRGSYLPLLELSVKECPEDDRNMHYLGREYMYYGMYDKCIDTLIQHLNLKTATWKDERCASMRFIGRSYKALKNYEESSKWYERAINEAPYLRDPYVEMALLQYELKDWDKVIFYCDEALKITDKYKSYINETFSWDNTIYDLKSIAYYNLNNKEKALENINIALSYAKDDERLKNNKIIIENMKG